MYKKLQGEIRVMRDEQKKDFILTFSLKEGDTTASYELPSKDAQCQKEVEQLVQKILEYKPSI